MYLKKKSSKRKTFAPISAKRQKKRRIKRFFLLFMVCLFLFLCFWSISKGFEYVFEHKNQWFSWKAKSFVIKADDEYTQQQIQDLLSFKEDSVISAEDAENLQSILKTKLIQLQTAQVKRGFFSKKLYIKTKNYDILAKVDTKDKSYLLSTTGVLFNYDKAKVPENILRIQTEEEIKGEFLSQELVKLVKDIAKSSMKNFDFMQVNPKKETFSFYLKDGSVVDMGLFDLYNDKIAVLKDIMDVADKKGFKKPYKIDFGYFKNGKIYLSSQV